MFPTDLFDNTLSYDMVRQTAERLAADNIWNITVDQLHHLSCKEPAFTGLVTGRNDRLCHTGKITDICGRMEVPALGKGFISGFTHPVDSLYSYIAPESFGFLKAKVVCFEILVIEAVAHKVDQIRNNRLRTFRLQKVCQMIIGSRKEFDQNLAYNTYSWFLFITDRDGIKIMNHFPAHFLELTVT